MHSEAGFRRLINFSDAVVAIAITLLILPLVDAANTIGSTGLGHFLDNNSPKLLGFVLSFVVIGRFWWTQHATFERLQSYDSTLVGGMFLWLFGIVFLPFPTELLGSAHVGGRAVHGLYIGTLLFIAFAGLIQQVAAVRNPELQREEQRGSMSMDDYVVYVVLMSVALFVALAVPSIGLWALVALLLQGPLSHLIRANAARPSLSARNTEQVGIDVALRRRGSVDNHAGPGQILHPSIRRPGITLSLRGPA